MRERKWKLNKSSFQHSFGKFLLNADPDPHPHNRIEHRSIKRGGGLRDDMKNEGLYVILRVRSWHWWVLGFNRRVRRVQNGHSWASINVCNAPIPDSSASTFISFINFQHLVTRTMFVLWEKGRGDVLKHGQFTQVPGSSGHEDCWEDITERGVLKTSPGQMINYSIADKRMGKVNGEHIGSKWCLSTA